MTKKKKREGGREIERQRQICTNRFGHFDYRLKFAELIYGKIGDMLCAL